MTSEQLSLHQVAQLTGVHHACLRQWVLTGVIEPVVPGLQHGPNWRGLGFFDRKAAFACAVGAVLIRLGAGTKVVRRAVHWLSRNDLGPHFEQEHDRLYVNAKQAFIGPADACFESKDGKPVILLCLDLRTAWQSFQRQLDQQVKAAAAAARRRQAYRPRPVVLAK